MHVLDFVPPLTMTANWHAMCFFMNPKRGQRARSTCSHIGAARWNQTTEIS
jgi:hypothetical protein